MIAVNQPGAPPQCARIHYDINGKLAMGTHLVSPNDKPEWLCCNCAESAQRNDLKAAIEFALGRERTDALVAERAEDNLASLRFCARGLLSVLPVMHRRCSEFRILAEAVGWSPDD